MKREALTFVRRATSQVQVGDLCIGSDYPIRLQTMANTDTNDVPGSVAQAERCFKAGAEIVRFTTQGSREAESLRLIHEQGHFSGPLVADVHFNPAIADLAAQWVEKVRINPGNYSDPDHTRFKHLLSLCKAHHTALRIGVNHGSLSARILNEYGDTPQGMVVSCMEFLRVAVEEQFPNIVLSVKASNTRVMTETVRLLIRQMDAEGMSFPLHLGVTEAGEGEDGRIKSAVGIGSLLYDGIGDTIRVSLSEAPENEIPVARALRDYFVDAESIRYHGVELLTDEETVSYSSPQTDWALMQLQAAADCGKWLLDGGKKRVKLLNPNFSADQLELLEKDILQAAGLIRYKTEYVSCPSCGRTLFDLQEAIRQVRAATSHFKGLKIAIMGCIVNGPGEMADADFGYVGAGRGRVSLYRGKECVLKNIPQEEAVQELVKLIEETTK